MCRLFGIIQARCQAEACTAVAGATGKLPRARRGAHAAGLTTLRTRTVTKQLPAATTTTLKLRLPRRPLKAVRSALLAGKRPKLKVTVRATDTAGAAVARTLTVKTKR